MNRNRVENILSTFPKQTILVVGDIMLDEFIWGKVRRISPEAPVPVVEVIDETYRLGGAGNVAANIRGLDGRAIPIGVVGRDAASNRSDALLIKMTEAGYRKAFGRYREQVDVEIGQGSARGASWWSRRLVQLYEDAGLVFLDE